MASAQQIRAQIETKLAGRIPSALTPVQKLEGQTLSCGISEIDMLLGGGLAVGSIHELTGAASSGRTTIALSLAAGVTQSSNICAWIDVTNSFDPVSAAANNLDIQRMLWVRCGLGASRTIWQRIDEGIRVTDLLLQAGGFQLIVLDMGDIAPEFATRVPGSTWFRYRAAAEQTRCCVLLLTQHPCAKSSATVSLQLSSLTVRDNNTVLSGIQFHADNLRQRFGADTIPNGSRRLPQSVSTTSWKAVSSWVR